MEHLVDLGWDAHFQEQFERLARPELVPARVAAEHRGRYQVWGIEGVDWARPAGRLKDAPDRGAQPTVGDWVAVRPDPGGLATVEHLLVRRSAFVRRAAGTRPKPQVVAANVDTVLLVVGLDRDFNPRRIERYLAQLRESGARPAVVLNKADLDPRASERAAALNAVVGEVPVHLTAAAQGAGVEALRVYIGTGQTVALVGSSGAGKSTLVNALIGGEVMRVGEVRARDQRGRHTTTHRQLVPLGAGGLLLDTPGMRELQLWETDEDMTAVFEDVAAVAAGCRFADCLHRTEPGCAVREAVAAGTLDEARVDHWRRLAEEASRQARPQQDVKREGRQGGRMMREANADRARRRGGPS